MQKLLVPYAIDLGNGYTKRTSTLGKVITEPSTYVVLDDYFSAAKSENVINNKYLIGNDAMGTVLTKRQILGDSDQQRYFEEEFKAMLLGFIAKDHGTKSDKINVPLLVTGLPVTHFENVKTKFKETFEGDHTISFGDREINIHIRKVILMPQPVGTYIHLTGNSEEDVLNNEVLVIDGGFGTLDITELKGNMVGNRAGEDLGVVVAYAKIHQLLKSKELISSKVGISDIPRIMNEGTKVNGVVQDVSSLKEVEVILDEYCDQVFQFIRSTRMKLEMYDEVIFTGGMSALLKDRILNKDKSNYTVISNPQIANVMGYFAFGKVFLENEAESTVLR